MAEVGAGAAVLGVVAEEGDLAGAEGLDSDLAWASEVEVGWDSDLEWVANLELVGWDSVERVAELVVMSGQNSVVVEALKVAQH